MGRFRFLIVLYVICIVVACERDFEHDNISVITEQNSVLLADEGINMYSLDVMHEARDYVYKNKTRNRIAISDEIQPTHCYVQFFPENRYQVDALSDNYVLSTLPLDNVASCVASADGPVNSSSSLDENGRAVLYSMVDADMLLPDSIDYNVIEYLYDPSFDVELNGDQELVDDIIGAAYSIVTCGDITRATKMAAVCPTGVIRVWDDFVGAYIPVEGVTVYIHDGGHPKIVTTNSYGEFTSNSTVSNPVITYIVQWRNNDYAIKHGDLDPALTYAVPYPNGLTLNIPKSDAASYNAATVFRAAYHYCSKAPSRLGVTKPTLDGPIRISCHNAPSNTTYNAVGLFWPLDRNIDEPNIEVWCKNRNSRSIIGTTIHELGHAAHYSHLGYTNFNSEQLHSVVKESWARFVQNVVADDVYCYNDDVLGTNYESLLHNTYEYVDGSNIRVLDIPDNINQQQWIYNANSSQVHYTPMFIDIYDDFNQNEWYGTIMPNSSINLANVPYDVINIPNIPFIEEMAFDARNVQDVKNATKLHVIQNQLSCSNVDIDVLFSVYGRVTY